MADSKEFFDHINKGNTTKGDFITLGSAMLDGETVKDAFVKIPLKTLNRHGLIAGATGLIGERLLNAIKNRGNEVSVLTTNKDLNQSNDYFNFFYWNPELGIIDETCVYGVDVIINLAGSPIAQLWTRKAKKSILDRKSVV